MPTIFRNICSFWGILKKYLHVGFFFLSSKFLKNCRHSLENCGYGFKVFKVIPSPIYLQKIRNIGWYLVWSSSKIWVFKYKTVCFSVIVNISIKKNANLHLVYQTRHKHKWINPFCPDPGWREKVNLNFYFHTSLWCRKRFYKGL